ncbi:MAG: response regulator [Acidobacteriia bacterium]|nr:response regulator [Terriglobia bacterium]
MMAKLLLVEDGRYLRMASKRVLTDAGFRVDEAINGEQALQMAHHNQPDLIVLDMLLPKMGGEQVLRALRQDPATVDIPVVVISSLSQCNADKLKEEGAVAYLEKSKLDLTTGGDNLVRLVKAALRKAKPRVGAGVAPNQSPVMRS